jgi:hypothetical protein
MPCLYLLLVIAVGCFPTIVRLLFGRPGDESKGASSKALLVTILLLRFGSDVPRHYG